MPEPNVFPIQCRTLTPIWTGDIDRNSGAVKESGILGSLRFWFEGLARSRGIYVCGKEGQNEDCPCACCELFGKTGRARAFRLTVDNLTPVKLTFRTAREMEKTTGGYLFTVFTGKKFDEYRGQDFEKECLWAKDKALLTLTLRAGASRRSIELIALTLREAALLGGIGAKTQLGFGQVELVASPLLDSLISAGERELDRLAAQKSSKYTGGEFTLAPERFFSMVFEGPLPDRYRAGNCAIIGSHDAIPKGLYFPCAFDVRFRNVPFEQAKWYTGLRPNLIDKFSREEVKQILGYLDQRSKDQFASRLHVSHLYKLSPEAQTFRMKIWGDVDAPEDVMDAVEDYVFEAFKSWKLV